MGLINRLLFSETCTSSSGGSALLTRTKTVFKEALNCAHNLRRSGVTVSPFLVCHSLKFIAQRSNLSYDVLVRCCTTIFRG